MDDKSKLYVFEKKEIFLIFLLMIFVAATAFTLGVRVGKNYSYAESGLIPADKEKVELLSKEEEAVKKLVSEAPPLVEEAEKMMDTTHERLAEEFKQLDDLSKKVKAKDTEISLKDVKDPTQEKGLTSSVVASAEKSVSIKPEALSGRFTIQLGSYRSMEEAEKFADGFKVRGYDPIISNAPIAGRGTWYRVSLGSFATVQETKEYVQKEKSLFLSQDYVIAKFE